MKKISTERLVRVYVFVSIPLIATLLGLSVYSLFALRSAKAELDTVGFNAMQACGYAAPEKIVSNCATR